MSLPIKPGEFSRHTPFRVVDNRGNTEMLDRSDVIVRDDDPTATPVDWTDAELVSAREQAVKDLILEPSAAFLGELGEGLAPGEKIPDFERHRPAVASAIATLQELLVNPELPAEIRGAVSLLLAGFEGKIAGQDRDSDLGKLSFRHLAWAHEIDPDNVHAWGSYGMTMLAFSHLWLGKRAAVASKRGLDIDIHAELRSSLGNLSRFPDDPAAQCYLEAILGDLVASGKATAVDVELLPVVRRRLEVMRAEPDTAARLADIEANLRARLAEM